MAILHSCCWWRSVRKGTFASVIYTFVYFGSSCIIYSIFLHDERQYLSGEVDMPMGESFLEKETISPTTVIFNILLLCCAVCIVISSLLVIVGLKSDRRELLLPWILIMIANLLIELAHFIYLIILKTLEFVPLIATLFTIDFFNMCLDVYCLLCVISQYQEYKAGRGGARHDLISQSNMQYIPPSTTNICPNNTTFRTPSNRNQQLQQNFSSSPMLVPHTNCTIIPEESHQLNGSYNIGNITKSPFLRRHSKLLKKHVQFPDEIKLTDDETQIICSSNNDSNDNGHHQTIIINPPSLDFAATWTNDDRPNDKDTQNI